MANASRGAVMPGLSPQTNAGMSQIGANFVAPHIHTGLTASTGNTDPSTGFRIQRCGVFPTVSTYVCGP